MALTKRWAGKAWGTNIGNVFVSLEGEDNALTGVLRMNEPGIGIYVYNVAGSFDAPTLKLTGQVQTEIDGVVFGDLALNGMMNDKGELHGEWQTTIGSGGTFHLFPHSGPEEALEPSDTPILEQFHVARHNFGAIEVDHEQIVTIGENIRQDFPNVIVTVVAGTEQARYLDDFKQRQFNTDKAEVVKIYAQRPDERGFNQVVSVEFGPQINTAMTQGASEAWVLGRLETLKRDLKRYERTYVTNFKRWGIGINQLLLLGTIVFLPSLNGLRDRTILMGAVLALIGGVYWFHSRYLPFAAIHLREKKKGLVGRAWPSIASWGVGILATVAATLLAAYLQGWLEIPSPAEVDASSQ
jgi:hypothetical protein